MFLQNELSVLAEQSASFSCCLPQNHCRSLPRCSDFGHSSLVESLYRNEDESGSGDQADSFAWIERGMELVPPWRLGLHHWLSFSCEAGRRAIRRWSARHLPRPCLRSDIPPVSRRRCLQVAFRGGKGCAFDVPSSPAWSMKDLRSTGRLDGGKVHGRSRPARSTLWSSV